ncbi:MAG: AAA family ATPase [Chitinophagaceae bacterium]|jgi:ABC-type molybdenum transport system ATPase subunit/photorepair protein PhrA|nr:AAA family ATPase [Chitinophagaceae bacterium]MCA6465567.1 AAA family ATPase [Chitinophagaceae bacterium]
MKRISKLTINNFKAFKESETIHFDSKNILVHGTNGSGKSSVYWTLYTFLQSSVKTDLAEVHKYFRLNDPQSLRNIHAEDEADSFIELELEDTESHLKQTYKISETLVNTQEPGDSNIKDANQASDFINYRLLLNFYNSAHSEEIELFWVFHRDILPYFNNANGENFGELYKSISENTLGKRKETERNNRGIAKLSGLTIRTLKRNYNTEIENFNRALETFVIELIQPANNFLNRHFLNNDASLKISLSLAEDASYNERTDELSPPSIKMTIEQMLEDGTYKLINRPHSFLNEARLTQIALSVRLAAMLYRPQANDLFKFLVLDDMLISLDMSNRMTVVKIILTDPDFADFQLIILTHDKAFFNLIKRKTISQDWKYFDFVRDNHPASKPVIRDSKTDLEKAKEYFENKDFDGCANFLRKAAENMLTHFIDPNMNEIDSGFETLSNKINRAINTVGEDGYMKFKQSFIRASLTPDEIKLIETDFENDGALSPEIKGKLRGLKKSLLKFTVEQNLQQATSRNVLTELQEIKDRILNPHSHGNDMPLYEQELKDAIEVIEELKVFLDSKAQP